MTLKLQTCWLPVPWWLTVLVSRRELHYNQCCVCSCAVDNWSLLVAGVGELLGVGWFLSDTKHADCVERGESVTCYAVFTLRVCCGKLTRPLHQSAKLTFASSSVGLIVRSCCIYTWSSHWHVNWDTWSCKQDRGRQGTGIVWCLARLCLTGWPWTSQNTTRHLHSCLGVQSHPGVIWYNHYTVSRKTSDFSNYVGITLLLVPG